MAWRAGRLVGETLANLKAERLRGASLVAFVMLMVGLPVFIETSEAEAAIRATNELDAAGRHVFHAIATGEGEQIPAERCDELEANPAVKYSGGFREGEQLDFLSGPGEAMNIRYFTGNLHRILDPTVRRDDRQLYLSSAAAKRFGVVDGSQDFVSIRGQETEPAIPVAVGVLDSEQRLPDPGPWVWVPVITSGTTNECWVEFDAGVDDVAASEYMKSWLRTNGADIIVQPHLTEDRFRNDPLASFTQSPTRWAWVASGLLSGIVLAAVMWFRRSDFALYRSTGLSKSEVAVVLGGPYVAIAFVGAVGGVVGSFALYLANGGTMYRSLVGLGLLEAGLAVLLTILVVMLSAALLARRNIAKDIRDRT